MHSVKVVGSSQVFLSDGGWVSCADWCGDHILGLNRHGQFEAAQIALSPQGTTRSAYVGTKSAFGALAPETLLIDASGRKVEVASRIRNGDIGDIRLETVIPPLPSNLQGIWQELAKFSFAQHGSPQRLCVGELSVSIDPGYSAEEVAQVLLTALTRDDAGVVLRRRETGILAWLLSSLRTDSGKQRYACLSYNSLQHTCSIGVEILDNRPVNEFKGACAFVSAEEDTTFTLEWESSGWSPIASGFLLAKGA